MTNEDNNFDLIRLAAATQVAVVHATHHLGLTVPIWISAVPGVPVFFFVSGFLIFRSFQNSDTLANYALNRALRIYPALVACFALSVLSVVALGYLSPFRLLSGDALAWAAAQLTAAQFYNAEFMRGYGSGVLNGSLWTISTELQFYVLTPVLFYLTRRTVWAWLALIVAFIVPNALWSVPPSTTVQKLAYVSFLPWLYMFILGAWVSQQPWLIERVRRTPLAILLLAFLCVGIVAPRLGLITYGNAINPLSYLALAALIVKLAYTAPALSKRLLGRNDISYGLYIYHMPVVNGLMYLGYVGGGWHVTGALTLTYIFALASWLVVEKPALALKRRTLRRMHAARPRLQSAGPQDVSSPTHP